MKVLTVIGTRPEIIRLSRIIPRLDEILGRSNHILVHTGQNYDPALSGNFFAELGLREPDQNFGASGSFGQQLAVISAEMERVISREKPDRALILGDTNSSLAAIVCARMGVPVYHMEAGNRSFSPDSPEEVNRRIIDHCSSVHLPYTERSRANLLAEGIHSSKIFVTGNPIFEVMQYYHSKCRESDVLTRLGLTPGRFFLVTLHRAETVDNSQTLDRIVCGLELIGIRYGLPVIVSTHPRTRKAIQQRGVKSEIQWMEPFPFCDFLNLEHHAACILTDSGTVQEEACIVHKPCVVLREHTERPETMECGATILAGTDPLLVMDFVDYSARGGENHWIDPPEYLRSNVAKTACNILTGHYEGAYL